MNRSFFIRVLLLLAGCVFLASGFAQDSTPPAPIAPAPAPHHHAKGPHPFGASLFSGNFLKTREDGLNPDYVIKPGDTINIRSWGAVNTNQNYTVDVQGNIFIPEIGPVHLEGISNRDLTAAVKKHVSKVYTRNVEIYTNLVTSQPVAVFVTGMVNNPGRYNGLQSDSVLYYLDLAGGIDPALGSYRDVDILRNSKVIATIDLYDFILRGQLDNLQLRDNDTILVHHRGPVVELEGNVARPSLVELKPGNTTGGGVLAIIPQAAEATEVTLVGMRNGMPFNQTLSLADFRNVSLQDGDTITLRNGGTADTILVNLEGEFEGPSVLSVRRGARLVDVLNHIPVNPELADTADIYLRRVSVVQSQRDAINDSLFRLERSALLAESGSSNEVAIRVQEAKMVETFAKRARLIDPLGRVVTTQNGVEQNILLEPGDTIVIPTRTQIVSVSGEVLMMHASTWRADWSAMDYIRLAGGFTERSDRSKIIIHHPNAEVEITTPGDAHIRPGDEILVLPSPDVKFRQFALDMMDVLYKIAISAKVALNL